MKNVNIMGVHQFLGEGRRSRNIYIYIYIYILYILYSGTQIYGELPKKGDLENLQWAWQKIRRRVFLRGG